MRLRIFCGLLAVPVVLGISAIPAAAGGFCMDRPLTDARGTTVLMKDYCYTPNVVRVDPGGTVTWVNNDIEPHTITAVGGWGSGHKEIFEGDRASFRFTEEGVFPYACLLHPGMTGAIVVGDGLGPATASKAIEVTDPVDESAKETEEEKTLPAAATDDDSGMSAPVLVAIVLGAGAALYLASLGLRRRLVRRADLAAEAVETRS
jgi:plastocyanin